MTLQLEIAVSSGNSSYLVCYPATGIVNTNAAQTMMYWVYPANIGAGGVGSAASSNIGVYNGTPIGTGTTTGIQMGINQGTTAAGTVCVWTWGGAIIVQSVLGYVLPINTWTHIAYTCTAISGGTQTHSIYINGALNNSATNAIQITGTPTQFYFNGFPVTAATTGPESNTMQMDDIYYFNRILTAPEIQTIYTTKGQRDGITYGLIARYNFNESMPGANVVKANDYSGHNNTVFPVVVGTGVPPQYSIDWANIDTRPVQ